MLTKQTRTRIGFGSGKRPVDRYSVLVVCTANLCRSPAAEAVLRKKVAYQGLGRRLEFHSAGTAIHRVGQLADYRMRKIGRRRGYRLLSRSRQVGKIHLDRFDLVVAMGMANLRDLARIHPEATAELRLFSEFVGSDCPETIPDPYQESSDDYRYVWDLIEKGCQHIFRYCCQRVREGDHKSEKRGEPWMGNPLAGLPNVMPSSTRWQVPDRA